MILLRFKSILLNVTVPLVVLALYFFAFSTFAAWLVPEYPINVNVAFAGKAWRLALGGAGLSVLLALAWCWISRPNPDVPAAKESLRIGDGLLLLIPLAPVFQYLVNNQDILGVADSLLLLGVLGGISFLLVLVIPFLLGRLIPSMPLMLTGLAFVFSVLQMASLSQELAWYEQGNLVVQVGLVTGVLVVGCLLSRHGNRRLLYALAVAYFAINSVMQIAHARTEKGTAKPDKYPPPEEGHKMIAAIGLRDPMRKPHIYLLIYDSYVANETLKQYGLDNQVQEDYLASLGFHLYPHAYSLGADSVRSMNRLLDATVSFHGHRNRGVAGDGVVHRLLKKMGYETHGVFYTDYFFRGGGNAAYSFSYPVEAADIGLELIKAICMGEFRFDLKFNKSSARPGFDYEEFKEVKKNALIRSSRRPKFVYAHTPKPGHSQNSGSCRTNEVELYAKRLSQANNEMKADLDAILSRDAESIIIVAGDHGPYLTKNCSRTWQNYDLAEIHRLDIQDRYGTFLAIRWPNGHSVPSDQIIVLQDVFISIFAYLYDDPAILSAKVDPVTWEPWVTSGAYVSNGIIVGGRDDGGPLFLKPIPFSGDNRREENLLSD